MNEGYFWLVTEHCSAATSSMIWIGRDARGMIDMEENHENENRIPNHVIDNLARCLLPKIQTYFETENGQLAFQAWAEDKKNTQIKI